MNTLPALKTNPIWKFRLEGNAFFSLAADGVHIHTCSRIKPNLLLHESIAIATGVLKATQPLAGHTATNFTTGKRADTGKLYVLTALESESSFGFFYELDVEDPMAFRVLETRLDTNQLPQVATIPSPINGNTSQSNRYLLLDADLKFVRWANRTAVPTLTAVNTQYGTVDWHLQIDAYTAIALQNKLLVALKAGGLAVVQTGRLPKLLGVYAQDAPLPFVQLIATDEVLYAIRADGMLNAFDIDTPINENQLPLLWQQQTCATQEGARYYSTLCGDAILIAAGNDVTAWHAMSGARLWHLTLHEDIVTDILVIEDDVRIFTTNQILRCSVSTGKIRQSIDAPEPILLAAGYGNTVTTLSQNGLVCYYAY